MKKSVKVTLIVAAALVGLGLCLAVAGLAMGGRFSDLRNLHLDRPMGADGGEKGADSRLYGKRLLFACGDEHHRIGYRLDLRRGGDTGDE